MWILHDAPELAQRCGLSGPTVQKYLKMIQQNIEEFKQIRGRYAL
jgi:transcriptional antiterminator